MAWQWELTACRVLCDLRGRNPLAVCLFIDTNIFLSFYHLSGEDLEELNKLAVLIEKGQIKY
jgi:hypothetical protein